MNLICDGAKLAGTTKDGTGYNLVPAIQIEIGNAVYRDKLN